MYSVKVSKRYGSLYTLNVTQNDGLGDNIVFPQGPYPLVFRTDASARNLGKLIKNYFDSGVMKAHESLYIDGEYICTLPSSARVQLLKYWNDQGISLGAIVVVKCEDSMLKPRLSQSTSLRDSLIDSILSHAT